MKKNLFLLTTALMLSISSYAENVTLTLYADGCSAPNVITCSKGQQLRVNAVDTYGYHFTRWSDGNTSNPRQVQVAEDKTYTAQFDKNTYSITTIANGKLGQISGNSSASYLDVVTLSATAIYGYQFKQWSDGNTDNPRSFVLTQDTTFEAIFDRDTFTITTNAYYPERGTTDGDTSALYLEYVPISATPNYGYHFTRWNDGNTSNPREVKVTGDKTYTAQFDKNRYTVSTAKDANITSVTDGGTYYYLDEIVLSATVKIGYQFDLWSDGNTDNPRTLIVTQDTSLTAYSSQSRGGVCGNDLQWNYSEGILVISGTGAMYDYTQSTMPWVLFKDSIINVVINNGCTSIGDFAFYGLSNKNFKTIDLPNSIEKIGQYAFANCEYLKNLYMGTLLEKISANAFANDERLLYITCYAIEPPILDESAFVNYDIYLSVPCEALAEYKVAKGWKKFNKENMKCIGAEETTVTNDDVTVNPNENDAAFTWPTNSQAASYSLQITKDGVVFCTLTFNSLGQLIGLAFAPGRGTAMEATEQAAIQSGNGFTFTVTGLNSASVYAFNMDVKDSGNQTIKSYTGTFQTKGGVVTNLKDQLPDSPTDHVTKILKDGHLIILRDGKTYNAQGGEL